MTRESVDTGDVQTEWRVPESGPFSDEATVTLYIVASNYADDPHPHIELVTTDEDEADELMDDCRRTVGGPFPVAWQKFEREVELR